MPHTVSEHVLDHSRFADNSLVEEKESDPSMKAPDVDFYNAAKNKDCRYGLTAAGVSTLFWAKKLGFIET
jgi:hypothetical protein